jgi:hypothetical protein
MAVYMPLFANDAVFYASGNQLVPLQETDIAVKKEVLTITLTDKNIAKVDVLYTFYNNGEDKTVLMGFESQPLAWSHAIYQPSGIDPHIKDFTVEMNGEKLNVKNGVVHGKDFKITDEIQVDYTYVYSFNPTFKKGENIVHHTYSYDTSNGIELTFGIDYKLTPAIRWANKQIDDFTLIIEAPNTAKHFLIYNDDIFADSSIEINSGVGKTRKNSYIYDKKTINVEEVTIRNGSAKWHKENFVPSDELFIRSAEILKDWHSNKLGDIYDRGETYYNDLKYNHANLVSSPQAKRILRNLPYAHRGHIFKDKNLKNYFESLWWYMPDPSYDDSTKDFTKYEREYIKGKFKGVGSVVYEE